MMEVKALSAYGPVTAGDWPKLLLKASFRSAAIVNGGKTRKESPAKSQAVTFMVTSNLAETRGSLNGQKGRRDSSNVEPGRVPDHI
jgi:hypothetical protein